ncbi:hypothetical protein WMY93_000881 [Mugilogobius chulae]|uniref:THAP-type domain-containing protein n=1 Tax=Mugilogobius chulae TaxID=88201 RepID=A0AAW0Q8Q5_9GOBI
MTSKKTRFTFQKRQDSSSNYHCCVPSCTASSRFNSALSFFTFPKDEEQRKKWLIKIRRDELQVTTNTRVCLRHFLPADVIQPSTPQGRRTLRKGAVPVLLQWNNYSLPAPRSGVWERREQPVPPPAKNVEGDLPMDVASLEHNYCSSAEPAALDLALSENAQLRSELAALRRQMEKFGLERFAGSDEDIRLYTRFESYAHLMSFWDQIEPDLEQKDLAHRFKVHESTVSQIINTWAHFLYEVLGAIGIWMDEDTIKQNLPEVFSSYADTHIILDCIELHYQTPDSLLLQSGVHSSYKSHSTFKGLIGIAPHGSVTFISPLYEASIRDREILKLSGLVSLLKPSMAIMVEEGFLVEDLVPFKVYIPAFLEKKSLLSGAEVGKTQSIARLRVHVERVIRRVKEHKLFRTEIPLSLTGSINQLFAVACLLVNYQNGLLVKAWAS